MLVHRTQKLGADLPQGVDQIHEEVQEHGVHILEVAGETQLFGVSDLLVLLIVVVEVLVYLLEHFRVGRGELLHGLKRDSGVVEHSLVP